MTRFLPYIIIILIAINLFALIKIRYWEKKGTYNLKVSEFRVSKDRFFLSDSTSPLQVKEGFDGLKYFPINEQWKKQAVFIPRPDTLVRLKANRNKFVKFLWVGNILFQADTHHCELRVFRWPADSLRRDRVLIPFQDSTNGVTSHRFGRYVEGMINGTGRVIVDFNYAYNPFYVYNPWYVCARPPKQNYLPFKLEAGEMRYTSVKK